MNLKDVIFQKVIDDKITVIPIVDDLEVYKDDKVEVRYTNSKEIIIFSKSTKELLIKMVKGDE